MSKYFTRRTGAGAGVIVSAVLLTWPLIAGGTSAASIGGPQTMFGSRYPIHPSEADSAMVELGVVFQVNAPGVVHSIRFFKGTGNTGVHVGKMYGLGGVRLGTAAFSAETATGWQTASFASPIPVQAGQTYTAAYTAPKGHYADDSNWKFPSSSGALKALSGVYRYGGGFPHDTWNSSNYFVDINFVPTAQATPSSAAGTTRTAGPTTRTAPISTSRPATTSPAGSSKAVTSTVPPAPGINSPWPGATNTGVPRGIALRTVKAGQSGTGWHIDNSTLYVDKDNTVIDSLYIPFVVKILANNVKIKNSKIAAASYYTVNVSDPPRYYGGLTILDSEVDGGSIASSQSIAVMGNVNATYLRVNFHGFASSGPRLASGNVLQDSWIHGFVCQHPDHSAGTSANDGGSNIRVIHNTIDIATGAQGCASAAFELAQDFGSYDRITVTNNHFDGGAYCVYTGQRVPGSAYGQSTNVHIDRNTFGRKYNQQCGLYGPAAQVATGNGNTFDGNVWDGGAPLR